jgi:hypothetical protein
MFLDNDVKIQIRTYTLRGKVGFLPKVQFPLTLYNYRKKKEE